MKVYTGIEQVESLITSVDFYMMFRVVYQP